MRKFNAVFKEKQAISEQVLETKLLKQFKAVYSGLLEQYATTEFHDLDEETQVAFLRELNEYWTEEDGLSKKGISLPSSINLKKDCLDSLLKFFNPD